MSADYKCPNCGSQLKDTEKADYECERCAALVQEDGNMLKVDHEPDRHGTRIEKYKFNHAEEGQDHE